MKKFVLLFVVAFVALSLQAITITWSNLTLGGPDNSGTPGYGPAYCGLFLVAGNGNTLTQGELNSAITVTGNTTVELDPSFGALAQVNVSGSNTYGDLGAGAPVTLDPFSTTFDLTGDTVTFVLFNKYNLDSSQQWAGTAGYGLLTVEGIKADTTTVDLSGTKLEWSKNAPANHTTVTLPEPTVLALLAMGVAGVALRRRA